MTEKDYAVRLEELQKRSGWTDRDMFIEAAGLLYEGMFAEDFIKRLEETIAWEEKESSKLNTGYGHN
jgi:hypothetical protein